jgi:hypothetical protein
MATAKKAEGAEGGGYKYTTEISQMVWTFVLRVYPVSTGMDSGGLDVRIRRSGGTPH